jgi:hypothetical protein
MTIATSTYHNLIWEAPGHPNTEFVLLMTDAAASPPSKEKARVDRMMKTTYQKAMSPGKERRSRI